jgi:1-phosphofructokinase
MGHEQHTVTVFAPVLYLTVTVERSSSDEDEIHIHPGGQGFWIARMLKHLGERPLLCGPVGGESGRVMLGLLSQFGMDVSTIEIADSTPTIIQDRRSGDREQVASSPSIRLARHESDDVYGRLFDRALAAPVCVVTGQSEPTFSLDFYKRLGHDLTSTEVKVVADMHGPELRAFMEGGPVDLLKVSDEDLEDDGTLSHAGAEAEEALSAMDELIGAGAKGVVLSRQNQPALARSGDDVFRATSPVLDPADHRGAGDSMTAGLAAGVRRGHDFIETVRLGCAAGAANVTRHGLGSAEEGLIPGLAERTVVEPLGGVPA